MKVSELREKIKARNKEELQSLIVEMYKQIPKRVRESKEIDSLIDNPDSFKQNKKRTKHSTQHIDFSEVKNEVERFLQHAYAQYYFAPNRLIPKKERSNWRFTAKRLVEQVTNLANQPEYAKDCATLLEKLYVLFCYASGHYVFASQEPFHTINIPQEDFLKRVVLLKREVEEPERWIRDSLLLIVDNDVDYSTLYESLLQTLLEVLNNAPLKERAVRICADLLEEMPSKGKLSYKEEEKRNHLVTMIFMLQSRLGEYQEAVTYYKKHYVDSDEVKLDILLELIMNFQRTQDWIHEFDVAVEKGIKPRTSLQEMYKHIKNTNSFPEYMMSY
ncbi:hypothetical protein [Lederbergia ruris]|uniref:Uncharacterized protein n=1 Tax=Lederbergia ruris TaxID=217495 RepID=A0ABQ4KJU2_9BACI|nr:hypothetical protein [Lederbergia ruris]GIN57384.1 hypothetical protein J8TS2_17030 [Lederbergia ruris]